MRIAVIGGGLFGCTAAAKLGGRGHEVHLFEERAALCFGATAVNQFRLHEGYHYPRSLATAMECQEAMESFRRLYEGAIIRGGNRGYAIAKENSRVSRREWELHCEEVGLEYEEKHRGWVDREKVQAFYRVEEHRLDLRALVMLCTLNLREAMVEVFFNTPAHKILLHRYDKIVVAGYAGTNDILKELDAPRRAYKYQVVRKPVVTIPDVPDFRDVSVVVMDGPFGCIDPLWKTGQHIVGHVTQSICQEEVGLEFEPHPALIGMINRGIVSGPPDDQAHAILKAVGEFVPILNERPVHYQGSVYTVRAVLPMVEETDERPTLVEELNEQVIRIFSGKLGTAVEAAQQVCEKVDQPMSWPTQMPAGVS